jgi:hypothetical protein
VRHHSHPRQEKGEEMKTDAISFVIGMIFGAFIGMVVVMNVDNSIYHKLAIQHKSAHYDAQTAQFRWNDEVEK